MSKPFSFFSLRRAGQPSSPAAVEDAEADSAAPLPNMKMAIEPSPLNEVCPPSAPVASQVHASGSQSPQDHHGDSLFFREISQPPPSGAFAMHTGPFPKNPPTQAVASSSPVAEEAPMHSPNRQCPKVAAPGPAVAASLAQAARPTGSGASSHSSLWPQDGAPTPTPMPGTWSPGQVTSREIAQLRLDMREEIEQVKNDLFGAAMGVSALKDRLDGLEQQVAKLMETPPPPPGPRLEDMEAWINQRVEQAVQAAVQKALAAAEEKVSAELPTTDFFRMPIRPRQPDRLNLSEAPMILSTCPT